MRFLEKCPACSEQENVAWLPSTWDVEKDVTGADNFPNGNEVLEVKSRKIINQLYSRLSATSTRDGKRWWDNLGKGATLEREMVMQTIQVGLDPDWNGAADYQRTLRERMDYRSTTTDLTVKLTPNYCPQVEVKNIRKPKNGKYGIGKQTELILRRFPIIPKEERSILPAWVLVLKDPEAWSNSLRFEVERRNGLICTPEAYQTTLLRLKKLSEEIEGQHDPANTEKATAKLQELRELRRNPPDNAENTETLTQDYPIVVGDAGILSSGVDCKLSGGCESSRGLYSPRIASVYAVTNVVGSSGVECRPVISCGGEAEWRLKLPSGKVPVAYLSAVFPHWRETSEVLVR